MSEFIFLFFVINMCLCLCGVCVCMGGVVGVRGKMGIWQVGGMAQAGSRGRGRGSRAVI